MTLVHDQQRMRVEPRRGASFAAQLRALIWKEALVEARGRETVLAGVVFALLVLVIFNFAFDLRVDNVAAVAPGVLWVTVTFAGVLGVGTLFAAIAAHTRAREALLPLLLFPVQVPVILATVKTTGAAVRMPGSEP